MRVEGLLTICGFVIAGHQAVAQRVSSSLDFGATSMRYADSIDAAAISLSPFVRIAWPRAMLRGTGTYAQLGAGRWSTQGLLTGAAFTPAVAHVSAEVALSTGGSAHWDGTRTGQSMAMLRGHVDASNAGVWGGGGGGMMWDGERWHPVGLGEIGGWIRAANGTVVLTTAPTIADDTTRYVDSELDVHHETSHLELDGFAGFRGGRAIALSSTSRAWGGAAVTAWPATHFGVVFSAGTYPVDLTQGFPGGRYALVSVRLGTRPKSGNGSSIRGSAADFVALASADNTVSLLAQRTPAATWALRIHARAASRVEINGDFTGWQPTALLRDSNDSWSVTLPLVSGNYQLNVRIDGGPWIVPAGLLAISDEFGGRVGLLVIP